MLLAVPFLLIACDESIRSSEGPRLGNPPHGFTKPCASGVLVPIPTDGSRLPQLQVEEYWLVDRGSLATCRDRHSSLVAWYKKRDTEVNGVR